MGTRWVEWGGNARTTKPDSRPRSAGAHKRRLYIDARVLIFPDPDRGTTGASTEMEDTPASRPWPESRNWPRRHVRPKHRAKLKRDLSVTPTPERLLAPQ